MTYIPITSATTDKTYQIYKLARKVVDRSKYLDSVDFYCSGSLKVDTALA